MNPTNWQYTHRKQRESLDPRRKTDSREKTENGPYCGYSVNDKRLHVMKGTNTELGHHNTESHMSYRLNSNNVTPGKATDPDDEPVELSNVDGELARKLRELQQIQEQISLKKATITMKTTEPSLKAKTPYQMFKEDREEDLSLRKVDRSVKNTPFMSTLEKDIPFIGTGEKDVGFSCSKWSSASNNGPLKERVNVILQQRYPRRFLAKDFSTPYDHLPLPNPVEKTNMSTFGLNQDDHPLKLRMKALMNRRCSSGVLDSHGKVPVVETHPPSQSPSTTVVGNDLVAKGFQRFLNVLNKVADIEVLTKIVNDDKELHLTGQDILHSQPPVVKEKSDVCKSDSQRLQHGAEQRDRQSYSKERKTELLNQDISHGGVKRNIQREEESAQSDDAGSPNLVSSRRSRSRPVVEKKPKLEQHQEELQNILKTIGFSLDADDMCKLTERTQERLYGRKNETKQRLDSTGESKRIPLHSSSSTSVSDSPSSSPSHHQHSPSKTFRDSREQTQTSISRQKSREQVRYSNRDNNIICSKDVSPDPHPSPEDPGYHVPYPDTASAMPTYIFEAASGVQRNNSGAASAIPTYSPVQHSEYTAYNTYHSNAAPSIAWNYGPNAIPPFSYSYPPGFCNPVNHLCPSNTGALPGQVYPRPHLPAAPINALGHSCISADLSLSEGQTRQQSGPQYLHVINTGRSNSTGRCLTQVNIKPQGQMHQVQTSHLRSGVRMTTNTLRPEPPVEAGTKVLQKKTATHVINTRVSSGTACGLTQRTNNSTKTTTKRQRRAKRKATAIQKMQRKIEKKMKQSKEKELMTPAVALGISSENSQKDPAQMQTSNSPCGITTNILRPEPPEEAGTVQQKTMATHVINTETSSGTGSCQQLNKKPRRSNPNPNTRRRARANRRIKEEEENERDIHIMNTRSRPSGTARCLTQLTEMNIDEMEFATFDERDIHIMNTWSRPSGTARCLTQPTEMNIDEMEFATFEAYKYAVCKQHKEMQKLEKTASWIGRYIRKSKSNRDEYSETAQQQTLKKLLKRKRRIDILREENKQELDALNSYPLDKFSTEAKQLEAELQSSGNTTNNLSPELPGEDKSEAGQMERALPTEEQIKANLKKKLAAFNQKMKQQVPKPTETQPNANDW